MSPASHDGVPASLDGVIARLDTLVAESIQGASRMGYFAALYRRISHTVLQLLGERYFQDDARIQRLHGLCAGRYLAAVEAFPASAPACTAPWALTFQAAQRQEPVVLQHLFLALNAHVQLDLGVACVEIMAGHDLAELEGDFRKLNILLTSLVPTVEEELGSLSPLIHFAETLGRSLEAPMVTTPQDLGGGPAWAFATTLARTPTADRPALIAARSAYVEKLGQAVLSPPAMVQRSLGAVRRRESHDVQAIIRCLAAESTIEFEGLAFYS